MVLKKSYFFIKNNSFLKFFRYGWVLSCDEIPNDLGKKGRWKDLVVKTRQTNESNTQMAVDSFLNVSQHQVFILKKKLYFVLASSYGKTTKNFYGG